MNRLRGRRALITGGGRGIGLAIARAFAAEGADVAVNFRKTRPPEFHAVQGDVSKDARAIVAKAAKQLGGLDILVNNASHSFTGSFNVPLEKVDEAQWRHVLDVDLTGTLLCSKHAAPHLRKRGGAIVNFASASAMVGDASMIVYAAKAGVVGLTRTLAKALAPRVRVNAVAPGSVDSGWIERWKLSPRDVKALGRVGTSEEIAALTVFLASDDARFITGQTIVADGGVFMP